MHFNVAIFYHAFQYKEILILINMHLKIQTMKISHKYLNLMKANAQLLYLFHVLVLMNLNM